MELNAEMRSHPEGRGAHRTPCELQRAGGKRDDLVVVLSPRPSGTKESSLRILSHPTSPFGARLTVPPNATANAWLPKHMPKTGTLASIASRRALISSRTHSGPPIARTVLRAKRGNEWSSIHTGRWSLGRIMQLVWDSTFPQPLGESSGRTIC